MLSVCSARPYFTSSCFYSRENCHQNTHCGSLMLVSKFTALGNFCYLALHLWHGEFHVIAASCYPFILLFFYHRHQTFI